MEITFLGGAEEIGASCAAVDVDEETRILVDCGQRLGHVQGHLLPDFSFLEDGPPVLALLLTHSHIDHVGAIPALEPFLPHDCPVLTSAATMALARIMLQDAVRSAQLYRGGPGQVPLYAPTLIQSTLQRFRSVRWGREERLKDGLGVLFYPAGHILGAAMIEIRTAKESALFSGDMSVADQVSVTGAFVPAIEPDILVLESTYGNRLHTHRPVQEERIVDQVRHTLAEGGSVLFPTFALGRAQEVLMILGRAIRNGDLPPIPVWADGMVRPICNVYSDFADDMAPFGRRLAEQGLHPLLPDDLSIRPVADHGQRQMIATGSPCVVVASGGMLQGGASQFYARHWLGGQRNLIAVTGYQDEESPGHALLQLASEPEDQPRFMEFDGIRTEVRCHIGSYSLSAHADNGELVAVASKLKPKLILPVHGDREARLGLTESLQDQLDSEVILPKLGVPYSTKPRSKPPAERSRHQPIDLLALWPPWDPYTPRPLDLEQIHSWLARLRPRLKSVTVEELTCIWKSPSKPTDADFQEVKKALRHQDRPYFVPDDRRPEILQVTPSENLVARVTRSSVEDTLVVARELFQPAAGLQRIGFFHDEGVIQLTFAFPEAIESGQPDRLRDLSWRTGWQWELAGQASDDDLRQVLQRMLQMGPPPESRPEIGPEQADRTSTEVASLEATDGPPEEFTVDVQNNGAELGKRATVDHDQRIVIVELPRLAHVDHQELAKRFSRRTGYELRITT